MKQFQFPQDPGSVWIILDDGEEDTTIGPSQLPKAALKAMKEGRRLTVEELRAFRAQETDGQQGTDEDAR